MHDAKQKSLQELMSLMDDQILSRFKPKGKPPAPMSSEPDADIAALGAGPAEGDEMDPEAMRKLMEMYGKEDEPAAVPVQVAGSF